MRMMENILETILPILLHGVISSRTVGHHFIPPRCLKNSCLFHSGVPQCLCALFLRVSQNKFCMSSLKLSSRPYIPHPLNVKDSIYVVKHSCLVYIIINRPITIYYIQLGFLKAPVVQCGIPQGSPLSPLQCFTLQEASWTCDSKHNGGFHTENIQFYSLQPQMVGYNMIFI